MDKVVHFEIPAEDTERVQKFYGEVFGWHINPMPDMSYAIAHTGPTNDQDGMTRENGFINGGMFKRTGARTNPIITIAVESIEQAIERITAHGGKLVEGKQQVGNMGYTAYFEDSEGNVTGLWENIAN